MASQESNWKLSLQAASRFENIQKIQKCLISCGKSSSSTAQKDAFLAETEAYEASATKEEYDAACTSLIRTEAVHVVVSLPESGIVHPLETSSVEGSSDATIGKYEHCQHVASGMCSEVYRHKGLALKVITETHNIEPHNPAREVQILKRISHRSEISGLMKTFYDSHKRLVLEFGFMPYTLASVLALETPLQPQSIHTVATALFSALSYLHLEEIIHRDIKPTNILLATNRPNPEDTSAIKLCDFGTAWHPTYSAADEPADAKILEVGTTCYRAPETLFGNRSYGTSLDIWSTGCVLVECLRQPDVPVISASQYASRRESRPLFDSRSTEEDGNQLGLILSMFKTLGTPTEETWPEAKAWKTNPFGFWNILEGRGWPAILEDAGGAEGWGGRLVQRCLRFESAERITAEQAVKFLSENKP